MRAWKWVCVYLAGFASAPLFYWGNACSLADGLGALVLMAALLFASENVCLRARAGRKDGEA